MAANPTRRILAVPRIHEGLEGLDTMLRKAKDHYRHKRYNCYSVTVHNSEPKVCI